MRGTRIVAVACLTLGPIAMSVPAQAASTTISDPAGDAFGGGLDVTSAQIANRDSAYTATITFVADTPSNVIVAVGTRDGQVVRIISEHSSQGPDNAYLLDQSGRTVPCRGLASSWDRQSATLSLKMPSVCMRGGDYGAVHSWVLTETSSGRDVDYAPENGQGELRFTPWIPRG